MLLMSPWASATLGPVLRQMFQRWNVEDLVGHICLIVATTAIIDHGLARLGDEQQSRSLLRRHITTPSWIGVPVLVAVFFVADEGYHPDLFPAHVSTVWFGAYWIVLGILLVYLFGYAARVMSIVRKDLRSTATANLYLISAGFGVAATVIQVGTAEAGIDITLPVGCAHVWLRSVSPTGPLGPGTPRWPGSKRPITRRHRETTTERDGWRCPPAVNASPSVRPASLSAPSLRPASLSARR